MSRTKAFRKVLKRSGETFSASDLQTGLVVCKKKKKKKKILKARVNVWHRENKAHKGR